MTIVRCCCCTCLHFHPCHWEHGTLTELNELRRCARACTCATTSTAAGVGKGEQGTASRHSVMQRGPVKGG